MSVDAGIIIENPIFMAVLADQVAISLLSAEIIVKEYHAA